MAEREKNQLNFGDSEGEAVGWTNDFVILTPNRMTHADRDNTKINLRNVRAGLQQYQAFNNEAGRLLETEQKVGLLLEIFQDSEDLTSLAHAVEIQTEVEGLIESFIKSYSWAQWQIQPQVGNVTEGICLVPHINLTLQVGDHLLATHIHDFNPRAVGEGLDGEDSQMEGGRAVFNIQIDQKDIIPDDDEHLAIDSFQLRYISILSDRKIKFEGIEVWGDEDELEDPKQPFISYVLTEEGELEFEETVKDDPGILLRNMVKNANGPVSLDSLPKYTDWEEVIESLRQDPLARKALLYFLLPYCDMPTTDGHFYVLSADSYLPDGVKAKDHLVSSMICSVEDLEM